MGQRAPKPQTLLPGGPRWMQICGLWRSLPGVGLCYLSRGRTGQDMTKRYSSCCSLQGLEHFLRSLDTCFVLTCGMALEDISSYFMVVVLGTR